MSGNVAARPKKLWAWVVLLVLVSLMVSTEYDNVKARLTGERVIAHVDACNYMNAGRGSGWRCTGSWTLADGRTGSGKLWGVENRRPAGAPVTMYATRKHAVTDSWTHIAIFAAGVAALCALIGVAVWKYRQL